MQFFLCVMHCQDFTRSGVCVISNFLGRLDILDHESVATMHYIICCARNDPRLYYFMIRPHALQSQRPEACRANWAKQKLLSGLSEGDGTAAALRKASLGLFADGGMAPGLGRWELFGFVAYEGFGDAPRFAMRLSVLGEISGTLWDSYLGSAESFWIIRTVASMFLNWGV